MAISGFEGADAAHRKNSFVQSLMLLSKPRSRRFGRSGDEVLTENRRLVQARPATGTALAHSPAANRHDRT